MNSVKKTYTKEEVAKLLDWLLTKCESNLNRYIQNERFLMEYVQLPLWKKILWGNSKIIRHLKEMMKNASFSVEYDFDELKKKFQKQ